MAWPVTETLKLPTWDSLDESRFLQRVRPSDWSNPLPRNPYDLLIIGAGPAGLEAADEAVRVGASVALIERIGLPVHARQQQFNRKRLTASVRPLRPLPTPNRLTVCALTGAGHKSLARISAADAGQQSKAYCAAMILVSS